jgi:hypothetical protein
MIEIFKQTLQVEKQVQVIHVALMPPFTFLAHLLLVIEPGEGGQEYVFKQKVIMHELHKQVLRSHTYRELLTFDNLFRRSKYYG